MPLSQFKYHIAWGGDIFFLMSVPIESTNDLTFGERVQWQREARITRPDHIIDIKRYQGVSL